MCSTIEFNYTFWLQTIKLDFFNSKWITVTDNNNAKTFLRIVVILVSVLELAAIPSEIMVSCFSCKPCENLKKKTLSNISEMELYYLNDKDMACYWLKTYKNEHTFYF